MSISDNEDVLRQAMRIMGRQRRPWHLGGPGLFVWRVCVQLRTRVPGGHPHANRPYRFLPLVPVPKAYRALATSTIVCG